MDHVVNPFKSPNIISFCTGIRGLERGIERAIGELNVLVNVEIEAFCIENLLQGMEQGILDTSLIFSDVKNFPAHIFRGKTTAIFAGYPCTPFSNSGKRKGQDDPRHIWPHILNHWGVIRPFWGFLENVEGHTSLGFNEVLYGLRELGYTVEAGLFSAAETGATQERTRLFALVVDNSLCLRPEQKHQISARWHSTEFASEKLGDHTGIGMEGHRPQGQQESQPHAESGILMRTSGGDRWPAGRGEQQHDWEEPRTVKSGMGCTVNGYNYREDFGIYIAL